MKNKKIIVFLYIFLLFIPFPMPGKTGTYNKISGLFWCKDYYSCVHEIGHKIDDEARWISHTDEFYKAINMYVDNPIERGFLSKNMEELYAEIFARSGGVSENTPEHLREFYDWERAEELIERYVR